EETDGWQFARLVGVCCDRPRSRRAAEKRDELAASYHSITSSARASSDGGISRPSALAAVGSKSPSMAERQAKVPCLLPERSRCALHGSCNLLGWRLASRVCPQLSDILP